MTFIHTIGNLLLATPIIYTFFKTKESIAFLEETTGPLTLETESLECSRMLSIAAPAVIMILVLLQFAIIFADRFPERF